MERQAARAWLEAHAGERPRVRALFGIDGAEATGARSVSVRGRLLEVDFLAPDAVATRRDPVGVLYHVVLAEPDAAAPAPEDAPAAPDPAAAVAEAVAAAEAPAVARDVLGIALGAAMPGAVETVAAEIAPTASYSVRRDQMKVGVGDAEIKGWGSFATATLFYNEASRIAIGLFSEPPAAADEVTAIVRSQTFVDAGRPHPDAIEGILRDKYGPPAEVRTDLGYARVLLWRGAGEGPQSECAYRLADAARTAGIELHGLARSLVAYPGQFPSVWHDAAGKAWGADDSAIVSARDLFARLGECPELGEVLVALIMSDEDGMVRSLQLALADPAAAGRLVDLNEQAAQESAPTAATGLDVKL
jgi:hypothetical protein